MWRLLPATAPGNAWVLAGVEDGTPTGLSRVVNEQRCVTAPAVASCDGDTDYYEAKEIASYTYEAITTSKGMVLPTVGTGSKYLGAYVDENGEWLDGSHTYQITIPPDPPVVDFWSIAVYTNDTRTLIVNDQGRAVVGSQQGLVVEADGTVKVFVGPTAPDGYEANWVQSRPGVGFFLYFRLYGPTEAYYDKSWIMPDIQRLH